MIDRFRAFDRIVEVGIGRHTGVARSLARSAEVTATDVVERSVPTAVEFVLDDVTDPVPAVYRGADLIYALRLPPELHRPLADIVDTVGATGAFTTFGTEWPALATDQESVGTATLHWLRTE